MDRLKPFRRHEAAAPPVLSAEFKAGNPRPFAWRSRAGVLLLLFLLMAQTAELALNGKYLLTRLDEDFRYRSLASYQDFYRELAPLVEQAGGTEGFFRIEKNFEQRKNDSMTFGYKGITHYSSLYNQQLNQFTKQIGLGQGWYWNTYYGNTPLTDMLFNVRYILSRTPLSAFYRPVKTAGREAVNGAGGKAALYENPYPLPIGFMAKTAPEIQAVSFEAQNQILNLLCGTDQRFFQAAQVTSSGRNQFTVRIAQDGPCYLFMPVDGNVPRSILLNDVFLSHYSDADTRRIQFIGDRQEGECLTVTVESDEAIPALMVYSLDIRRLEGAWRLLNEGGLEVTEYGADYLMGNVHPAENGMMMTSIPYDKGFQVTVNGARAETQKGLGTFLSFALPAGEQEICIRYLAPGRTAGGWVSGVSGAVLAVLLGIRARKRRWGPLAGITKTC